MSERAFPQHCPYCGEQDLWPHDESHGSWECRGCLRAFSLKMLGLVRRVAAAGTDGRVDGVSKGTEQS
jgi:ribosomal protein L37AE/L43A